MPFFRTAFTFAFLAACGCSPVVGGDPAGGNGSPGSGGGGSGGSASGGAGGLHHPDGHVPAGTGGSDDAGAPPDDGAAGEDAPSRSDMAMSVSDPAVLAIAGQLQGAFLQLDCASEEIELQYCHPKDKGIQNLTFKFGGEVGKTYQVVLRVWGVVEAVRYAGGQSGGEHFYIGGKGTTPGIAEYGLLIGPKTYYLNDFQDTPGEHYTYGISYETVPISIPGGTLVGLYVHDPDDFINTNHMETVAADPSPGLLVHLAKINAQPLQGQYVYLEVASATLATTGK
jgi:hypothetical protein